jgi:probable rRNA maturation factor
VLAVRVHGHGHSITEPRGFSQSASDCGSLSEITVMTHDLRAVILRHASGAIARPVIDDQNGQAHATFDVDDDAADRLFGVERRDDDTSGWHRVSLHGRTNGVRAYLGVHHRSKRDASAMASARKRYPMPLRMIIEGGPFVGVSHTDIACRAEAILLAATEFRKAELSLILTGDEKIRELNRVYRAKDRPTDVLAFAQHEGEFASLSGDLLGDVVVSVPTARRQAEREGRELVAELTLLIAHGVLHLLGWDHDTPLKDQRMRRETERLCIAAETAVRLRARRSKARQAKRAVGPPRRNAKSKKTITAR